jgi:hypothetical protein
MWWGPPYRGCLRSLGEYRQPPHRRHQDQPVGRLPTPLQRAEQTGLLPRSRRLTVSSIFPPFVWSMAATRPTRPEIYAFVKQFRGNYKQSRVVGNLRIQRLHEGKRLRASSRLRNRLVPVRGELVQTTAGKWITHPPTRCPNGYRLDVRRKSVRLLWHSRSALRVCTRAREPSLWPPPSGGTTSSAGFRVSASLSDCECAGPACRRAGSCDQTIQGTGSHLLQYFPNIA